MNLENVSPSDINMQGAPDDPTKSIQKIELSKITNIQTIALNFDFTGYVSQNRSTFASHPFARCWSEKNSCKPSDLGLHSDSKAFFDCDRCGHQFEAILNGISNGKWCPYCANNKRCGREDCQTCWNHSFASHPRSQFWSPKNNEQPQQVALKSNKKYIFQCDVCHHEFDASLDQITNDCWCPYCTNNKRCGVEVIKDCDFCWKKSFASHNMAHSWSPTNKKRPEQVALNDNRKYFFICRVCFHEFDAAVCGVAVGQGCPYCANRKRCEIEVIKDCDFCWKRSFVSHPKARFWSPRNTKQPAQVALKSSSKYFFICNVCCHEFAMSLGNLVLRNSWCAYCANRVRCDINNIKNCGPCWNKSFASHPQAQFWSPKNKEQPEELALNDARRFWFNCYVCFREFDVSPNHVVQENRWCPYCRYKTETLVFKWCKTWDLETERNVRFDYCVSQETTRHYPFDIFCPTLRTVVEVDGAHHFREVTYSNSDSKTVQSRDAYKMRCAVQNGLRVVRVNQEDVWKNPDEWKTRLYKAVCVDMRSILMLSEDPKCYDNHLSAL